MCDHHAKGGAGAVALGEAVIAACTLPAQFKFLYPLELSIKVRPGHCAVLPPQQDLSVLQRLAKAVPTLISRCLSILAGVSVCMRFSAHLSVSVYR